jgi:hypothetical protein
MTSALLIPPETYSIRAALESPWPEENYLLKASESGAKFPLR